MKKRNGLVAGVLSAAMVLAFVPALKNETVRASAFQDDVEDVQIAIDETNFPDAVFRQYVLDNVDKADPKNVLTANEIAAVKTLDVYNTSVSSLKGIEYFTELQRLDCCYTDITELDLSMNTKIEKLSCYGCDNLTELNLSACVALEYLACYDCDVLAALDVSGCVALKELYCHDCYALATLNVSDCVALKELDCKDCEALTELVLGSHPELVSLDCSGNKLTSLDVSNFPKLESLSCYDNKIEKLKINRNPLLRELECDCNPITEIEVYSSPYLLKLLETVTEPVKDDYKNQYDELVIYYHYGADLEVEIGTVVSCVIDCDLDDVLITEAPIYSVAVTTDGNGMASATCSSASEYTEVALSAVPNDGYGFKEWQVISGGVVIADPTSASTTFVVADADVEIKAIFEPIPRTITVTSDGRGTASASVTSGPVGTTVELTATANEGYVFAEWQVVSGGVVLADAKSANTSFVIGNSDVEIKATFREPTFEDFVERLYVVALGRPSEAEGKAYWVDQVVNKGFTGADCARFFMLGAPEFLGRGLTDDQFVEVLYKTYFNRDSEADGKAYWLGRLAAGTERAVLVEEFIESVEWCNVCAGYGVKSGAKYHKATVPSKNAVKFATRLYTCCLGRDPEAEGLEYWALALTNLDATGYQAASCFFTLPEFVGLQTTNEEYLTRLYTTFMGREPEAEGFAYWLGLLNGGTDRVDVMKAFAGCQEFQEICNQYGIVRGEI